MICAPAIHDQTEDAPGSLLSSIRGMAAAIVPCTIPPDGVAWMSSLANDAAIQPFVTHAT